MAVLSGQTRSRAGKRAVPSPKPVKNVRMDAKKEAKKAIKQGISIVSKRLGGELCLSLVFSGLKV